MDLCKLNNNNSRIFEFVTIQKKNQNLAHAQKGDCVPLTSVLDNLGIIQGE